MKSENSGLNKIQKKLSLKVIIPEDKKTMSDFSKSKDDDEILFKKEEILDNTNNNNLVNITVSNEDNRNNFNLRPRENLKLNTKLNIKNDEFEKPVPSCNKKSPINSSKAFDIFSSRKRYRDEQNLGNFNQNFFQNSNFNNFTQNSNIFNPNFTQNSNFSQNYQNFYQNYLNFSPVQTKRNSIAMTPLISDSPKIPGFYFFNNLNNGSTSFTPTPIIIKTPEEAFEYNCNKSIDNNQDPENYSNTLSTNKENQDKPNVDMPNLVFVPTPGTPNLGFYTWVFNSTPIHENKEKLKLCNKKKSKVNKIKNRKK